MSLTKFRVSLSKWMKPLLIAIAAVFVVGCFGGFGLLTGPDGEGGEESGTLAVVNGETISLASFDQKYDAWGKSFEDQQQRGAGASEMAGERSQLLEATIQQTILRQAAEKRGISVSGREVNDAIEKTINDGLDQARASIAQSVAPKKISRQEQDRRLELLLKQRNYESLDQYKGAVRKNMDRKEVETGLMLANLQDTIRREIRMSEKELQDSYRQVTARHILISAQTARESVAKAKADKIHAALVGGEDFGKMAQQHSDDRSTKAKGGVWPYPLSSSMAFGLDSNVAKALFSLRPGQISDVIKTPAGFEIVKVDSEKLQLPPDFATKKKQYLDQQIQMKQMQAVQEFFQKAVQEAKVEVIPHELKGYWLMSQVRTAYATKGPTAVQKLMKDAAAQFQLAMVSDKGQAVNGGVVYTLSNLYRQLGDNEKARLVLEDALEVSASVEGPDLRMLLGDLYAAKKDYKRATEQYSKASEMGYADLAIHQQLVEAYKKIGNKTLAAKEEQLVKEYTERQRLQQGPAAGGAAPTSPKPGG